VFGISTIFEYVRTLKNPIITYTNSKAMSAGAILLAVSAERGSRIMSPNATVMIHELQASAFGDIKDIHDVKTYLDKENDKWMGILAKAMGLNNREDIVKLIKNKAKGHDLYLSAKEAKALNIVDHIGYVSFDYKSYWDVNVTTEKTQGGGKSKT
jgi:ATP-dependent protease ClpP protease subunit